MKTYITETIKIKHMSEDLYDMLKDFLEDNKIDYEELECEDYTIDERTEDEKYDDWLWTLADNHNDEDKMNLI